MKAENVNKTIKVQYFGALRLIIGKSADEFVFFSATTLKELIECIVDRYGSEVEKEILNHLILLTVPDSEATKRLKVWEGAKELLEDGSLIKIVTPLVGG